MPSAEPARPEAAAGPDGLRYEALHRLGPPGAWRPLLGVPLLVVLFFAGQQIVVAGVSIALLAVGESGAQISHLLGADPVTPTFLAVVNLGWAVAIPIVWLVARALHRQGPGWVASVTGRLRWRWLLACLGLSVVALAITVAVSTLMPDQGAGTVAMDDGLNPWTSTVRDFLLVVLLLTPLQAAGEEYVFRGYLAQAFGGLFGRFGPAVSATVAVVVPAVLFALAHGLGQDLPIFIDRLAFGLVAGVLVLLTGGLEAGIAMHVVNNFLAFGLALAFGDMTEALTPTDGTWWALPVTLTQSLSYVAVVLWVARRGGIQARTSGGILEGRRARV